MTKTTGTITQIVGVVVDAEFKDKVPAINDALTVAHGAEQVPADRRLG